MSGTLTKNGADGDQRMPDKNNLGAVLVPAVYESHAKDSRVKGPLEQSPTVLAYWGTGGNNTPLVQETVPVVMRESGQGFWVESTVSGTVDAHMGTSGSGRERAAVIAQETVPVVQTPAVPFAQEAPRMAVRRLTPVECERLQGFPDGWTDIRPKGKDTPDGPRYKALGNSMAVPVMRWIGQRIKTHAVQ